MNLVRTSLWNGIAVATRMGSALLLNKILAVYVGPAGYAVIGQFQNGVSMAVTFATGAIQTGVTKFTAEYYDDEARQRALWRTAGTVVLLASFSCALLIALFSRPLASLILNDPALSSVFLWLAASLVFIALNTLLLAILSGKKEVRRYVTSSVAGSLLGLATVGLLAWRYGLYGALVAFSVYQGIVFFVTFWQMFRTSWFRPSDLFGRIDVRHLGNLGHYVTMAATTAIVAPVSLILVRNHLGATFGWDYAGYWDATWRISIIYLALLTTTLSLYYLPRISEIRNWPELRGEILGAYKIVLPATAALSLTIFLLRDQLVGLLFTPQFLPMRELMGWQLAGDVLKIGSWLVAFLMVGRRLTGTFVATEIGASALLYLLTLLLTAAFGFKGAAMAYCLTYLAYWIIVYWLTIGSAARRERLFRQPPERDVSEFCES
jgi:PST family polysaccharide transporter